MKKLSAVAFGAATVVAVGTAGAVLTTVGADATTAAPPTQAAAQALVLPDKALEQTQRRETVARAEAARQRREAAARKVAEARRKAEAEAQARAEAQRRAADAAKARAARDAVRDPRGIALDLAAQRGWGSGQFSCLETLWQMESGWRVQAANPSSGAYGIPQALPGSKMAAFGSDWRINPVTQIEWGLSYIASSYGTPCSALSVHRAKGWY